MQSFAMNWNEPMRQREHLDEATPGIPGAFLGEATRLFTRTTDLVQRLQAERQVLHLEAAIAKLDRFDRLILEDIAYVTKDQAETSVLFELISFAIRATIPADHCQLALWGWGKVFADSLTTVRHRPPHSPGHHLRDERRKLPAQTRHQPKRKADRQPTPEPTHPRPDCRWQRQSKPLPATISSDNHASSGAADIHSDRCPLPS
jgi:IstB-like ATP binding protein